MRRLSALVLSLVLSLAALPATAAGDRSYLFAESAHASFASTDASGCIRTTVDLLGIRQRTQLVPPDLGDWRAFVEFSIIQEDTCSGAVLLQASESGPPAQMRFRVGSSLASGALDADVPATAYPGGTAAVVGVHLTWKATGAVTSTEQPWDAGFTRTDTRRPAEATGHVYLGSADLTPAGGTGLASLARTVLS
jgi:hypothetical protein